MSADMVNYHDEITRLLDRLQCSGRRGDAAVLLRRLNAAIEDFTDGLRMHRDPSVRWMYRHLRRLPNLTMLPDVFYSDGKNNEMFITMAALKTALQSIMSCCKAGQTYSTMYG